MNTILYSTGCPKCNVLKKKLHEKSIQYKEVTDVDTMVKMGFERVPILSVDNSIMDFSTACNWINNFTGDYNAD